MADSIADNDDDDEVFNEGFAERKEDSFDQNKVQDLSHRLPIQSSPGPNQRKRKAPSPNSSNKSSSRKPKAKRKRNPWSKLNCLRKPTQDVDDDEENRGGHKQRLESNPHNTR